MRITRPASELTDALKRKVPGVIVQLEREHGLHLEFALGRRLLPEAQRFLRDLVIALHRRHWSVEDIARWLDTDERAVERAIRKEAK